jgi:riboflavin biosynthesis pyrimidine reductase
MRLLDEVDGPTPDAMVTQHVALASDRDRDRALVRLGMISSVDGGSTVAGLSGGLGNRDDHRVFRALREAADAVVVGLGTARAEHYHAPRAGGVHVYVVADAPDVTGVEELLRSGAATLVVPDDSGPAPDGIPVLRSGAGGQVDLEALVAGLAGRVVVVEGGPSLAGVMVAEGLIDELFVTLAPRVVGGSSARIVHGPDADPDPWELAHGFVDDDGYLFLRYTRHHRRP